MKTQRIKLGLWLLFTSVAISACGWGNSDQGAPTTTQSAVSAQQPLEERVVARWQALIEKRYPDVYEFTTPAYRSVTSYEAYIGQFAEQINRTGVNIKTVNKVEANLAKVRLAIDYEYSGFEDAIVRSTMHLEDTWVRRNGTWYRLEDNS